MDSILGLNPYLAQLMLWFLGFVSIAVAGTLVCFITGLMKSEGAQI